ncbi:MAG: cytochrome c [Planctomycetota bacterium]|nr:cytochrome c [Planctomycetota bacterium]
MRRKWLTTAAVTTLVASVLAGASISADEDSPLHKIMEKVQAKSGAIRKATRTPAQWKKDAKKAAESAEAIVKLAKETKPMTDAAKKVKDPAVKDPAALWAKMSDDFLKAAEEMVKVAKDSKTSAPDAKTAFGTLNNTCGACHKVFRIEEDDFK